MGSNGSGGGGGAPRALLRRRGSRVSARCATQRVAAVTPNARAARSACAARGSARAPRDDAAATGRGCAGSGGAEAVQCVCAARATASSAAWAKDANGKAKQRAPSSSESSSASRSIASRTRTGARRNMGLRSANEQTTAAEPRKEGRAPRTQPLRSQSRLIRSGERYTCTACVLCFGAADTPKERAPALQPACLVCRCFLAR